MNNTFKRSALFISAVFFAAQSFAFADSNKSIYGNDDRLDYFEASSDMRKLADSVVSLWPSKQVKFDNGRYHLATIGFGEALNLCPNEKFREQPIGAFCSGTLVGEDIVLTAGHCITDEASCADTAFVFGYNIDKEGGEARTTVGANDLYGCKKIIKRDLDKQFSGIFGTGLMIINALLNRAGPDFAVIQLDRKVVGRTPLEVNRSGDIGKGEQVFVIGHPVGLPVKIAGSAQVKNNDPKAFFMTDLDTFGGNSGSAVFNAKTKKIEGILVRGGQDFVDTAAGCKVQNKLPQNEGRGEACTKISVFRKYIPQTSVSKSVEVLDMAAPEVDLFNEDLLRKVHF